NDVLDEFIRTASYRVGRPDETRQTSSPSMDISKASNFERFVCDLGDRDAAKVRDLWVRVERDGGFDLFGTPLEARLRQSGFLSGLRTTPQRIETTPAAADND